MNTIEKLENAIREMAVYIEENERVDRLTREKLNNKISELYNLTGEMKEEKERTYEGLSSIIKSL